MREKGQKPLEESSMNSDTTDSGQQGQPSDTEASREQDEAVGVEVPFTQLSADALRGVIESFVLQT